MGGPEPASVQGPSDVEFIPIIVDIAQFCPACPRLHPPRAARDVREAGIPLVTTSVMSSDGRRIGAYAFGTPEDLVAGLTGRTAISKAFKQRLVAHQGAACTVCGSTFEENYLQVDHRIPVEVGGDEADGARGIDDYMLLDAGCNRAKSWACEHCPNRVTRDLDLCATCFWAQPDGVYEHVATIAERRTMLTWQGDDAAVHDRLATKAKTDGTTVSDELKRIAREVLDAD